MISVGVGHREAAVHPALNVKPAAHQARIKLCAPSEILQPAPRRAAVSSGWEVKALVLQKERKCEPSEIKAGDGGWKHVKENTEDLSGFKSLARRLKAEYHSDKNTTKWEEAHKVFRHISKV